MTYKEEKICPICHLMLAEDEKTCPICNSKPIKYSNKILNEGTGRMFGAGGKACDYCGHCDGNADWCPWLD